MKKTFYQFGITFLIFSLIACIFMVGGIFFIVKGILEKSSIFSTSVFVLGVMISAIEFYCLCSNRVVFYDNKIFISGHKGHKSSRIQFKEEINFSEIKSVEHIFINENSKGKKIRTASVASLRPLSYFEFTLKNGKKKRICITYFSLKQRRKMIKIIREQANIDIDYNKMKQKDFSIYKRKNKN